VRDRRCICVFAFAFPLLDLTAVLAFADCVAAMLTALPGARIELLRWSGGAVGICTKYLRRGGVALADKAEGTDATDRGEGW